MRAQRILERGAEDARLDPCRSGDGVDFEHLVESTEVQRDDPRKTVVHRAFHAAVVGLAHNRQLDITLEPILLKLQLPMAKNLREEARQRDAGDGIERHKAILSALETNDAALAIAALRDHGHLHYLGLE